MGDVRRVLTMIKMIQLKEKSRPLIANWTRVRTVKRLNIELEEMEGLSLEKS